MTPTEPQVRSKNEAAEEIRRDLTDYYVGNGRSPATQSFGNATKRAQVTLDAALDWERRRTDRLRLAAERVIASFDWQDGPLPIITDDALAFGNAVNRLRAILTESAEQ